MAFVLDLHIDRLRPDGLGSSALCARRRRERGHQGARAAHERGGEPRQRVRCQRGWRAECASAPADAGLVSLTLCTLAGSSTRSGGLDDDLKRRIIETYYVREVKLVNGEEASARPVLRLAEEKRNIRFRDNVRLRTPQI